METRNKTLSVAEATEVPQSDVQFLYGKIENLNHIISEQEKRIRELEGLTHRKSEEISKLEDFASWLSNIIDSFNFYFAQEKLAKTRKDQLATNDKAGRYFEAEIKTNIEYCKMYNEYKRR